MRWRSDPVGGLRGSDGGVPRAGRGQGAPAARRDGRAGAVPARGGRGGGVAPVPRAAGRRRVRGAGAGPPGFGKSDEFPQAEAIDDLVYHYLDVIDALGLPRPHVVGARSADGSPPSSPSTCRTGSASLTLLSAAGLRLPDHPVADLFLLPPARLAATLFHDPPLARARAAARDPPDLDAIIAAYREATSLARFSLGAVHVRPQAGAAAAPDHRADPGRRAVRRPADPGRARAAVRRADPRRRLRRGAPTAGTRCTSSGRPSSPRWWRHS